MNYELMSDSCSNLTDEMIKELDVKIVSLLVRADGQEYYSYVEGEPTDNKKFYDMMRAGHTLETTQLNLEKCREVFTSILEKEKDLIYLAFSSALSGTYNVATMVAAELAEQYPQRKIYVVDSVSASMGQGLLLTYAAKMRQEGKSIEEVREWLEENKRHFCHWFTVDDLYHLKKGGRVSAATALVGTMLSIKPVLHVDDEGRLINVGKARGRKKSLEALVDKMEETCINPQDQLVYISHGDCLEDALYVEKLVHERLHVKGTKINYIDPVIGAHSGPGTVALFFVGTKR